MTTNYLITSALPYVNAAPHLGNIIGCVLPADVYSRYLRLHGNNVVYICGADEYGSATEIKAKQLGITPRELCDQNIVIHQQVYNWFNIDFDHFGRTSTPNPATDRDHPHTKIAQDIFSKLAENNYLVERESQQLYCPLQQMFLADRFVIGECPKCGFENAKGDQCDKCSSVYAATELKNPRSAVHPQSKLELRTTWHLYLDLQKLQPELEAWFNSTSDEWSAIAKSVTKAWFAEGLKERCITRDLQWGTPVPATDRYGEKYCGKVMYNWFDAPIGYISITEHERSDIWHSDNWEYIQFFGIDNIPFHSIIFPATLIGAGDKWLKVSNIQAGYHLNYNGQKFSKSNKIGIFGTDAMETNIPADVWRFYLLRQRPEKDNTEFSWETFAGTVNGELNNNLGNYIHRVLNLLYKNYNGIVPEKGKLDDTDTNFVDKINEVVGQYLFYMDTCAIRFAIEAFLTITKECNVYINTKEPWKQEEQQAAVTIHNLAHTVGLLNHLAHPFMPDIAKKLNSITNFGWSTYKLEFGKLTGIQITKPVPLFSRVTSEQINRLKTRFG